MGRYSCVPPLLLSLIKTSVLRVEASLPPHYALALVLHAVAHPVEGAAEADEFPDGFGEDCCDEEAADEQSPAEEFVKLGVFTANGQNNPKREEKASGKHDYQEECQKKFLQGLPFLRDILVAVCIAQITESVAYGIEPEKVRTRPVIIFAFVKKKGKEAGTAVIFKPFKPRPVINLKTFRKLRHPHNQLAADAVNDDAHDEKQKHYAAKRIAHVLLPKG